MLHSREYCCCLDEDYFHRMHFRKQEYFLRPMVYIFKCTKSWEIQALVCKMLYVTIITYFWVSLSRNQRKLQMFHLAKIVGKGFRHCCWEKCNFMLIYEFKYGETWKILPSPLCLPLYNTFNKCLMIWCKQTINHTYFTQSTKPLRLLFLASVLVN